MFQPNLIVQSAFHRRRLTDLIGSPLMELVLAARATKREKSSSAMEIFSNI